MKTLSLILISCFAFSCNRIEKKTETNKNQDSDLSAISVKDSISFKVLDSKFLSKASIWEHLNHQLSGFTELNYQELKPLVIERNINELQSAIAEGKLSYEALTKFYLYRIRKYDRENEWSLNSVIAINPNVIEEAKEKDRNKKSHHPIYGMPILLKDNINAENMPTTAGAIVMQNNNAEDAFIVKRLKANGAIILGKANLSEWAYFFCGECPSGYSAVGGQTLNPYGRKIIDTGGSSSGSGVAVAANFCAAAIGSETAGSILSPASQNATVGLKPTVGLLSRSGIVPISSTLDTSGPITKNVVDNAIVFDAMQGYDASDAKRLKIKRKHENYYNHFHQEDLNGTRFGAYKRLLSDSLYTKALSVLSSKGATIIEIEEKEIELPAFLRLLNLDMKNDLPLYLSKFAKASVGVKNVQDIINYNKKDSLLRAPYGQKLFEGIVLDSATKEEFKSIKNTLNTNGKQFFDADMTKHRLDGILSINNYHAAYAAVAEYPALTVPMGYNKKGEPKGLTIIGKPLSEQSILKWAFVYEQASKMRKPPKNYN